MSENSKVEQDASGEFADEFAQEEGEGEMDEVDGNSDDVS